MASVVQDVAIRCKGNLGDKRGLWWSGEGWPGDRALIAVRLLLRGSGLPDPSGAVGIEEFNGKVHMNECELIAVG